MATGWKDIQKGVEVKSAYGNELTVIYNGLLKTRAPIRFICITDLVIQTAGLILILQGWKIPPRVLKNN